MKVNLHPKESLLFNAFQLIFIIHSVQVGVGVVGLPKIVFLETKHDAWIVVFFAGVLTSVILWFMIVMLRQYDSADFYGIHVDVFGKWLGNFLSFGYIIYLIACFFVIFMNYTEIVQVWIFPKLPTWQLAFILILLAVYAVHGGIRVIVGVSFLSVIGTLWIILVLFVPLRYADFTHIYPIMNVDIKHMLKGIQRTSLSIMGFELIMFVYPFVKEKHRALLYVQIGNLFTTFTYTLVTFISIVFFAEDGLSKVIWPVISMLKIVRLPNLERFEFIAVSFWMLVILPNLCLYLWASSKGFSRIIKRTQKMGIWIIAIVAFGASFFVKARYQMNMVTDLVAKAGFYAAFCYPVVLSIIVYLKKWLARRKKSHVKSA
ncbi:GerAB/ArcD/ProY family transporter [Neobacillus vireti]|uniref:Spore germination protein B2 n=1 Tax=Neobacillus vireti LMG 21834 TaxID=1131730 RepID=A0AB94IN29_9BACI|nr:GerAB/ArcD/ProY family transporter [Neobacillus vireti]ETI68430.1 spore germination protein B2 [Neobacillus vireti LMG 21834]KLT17267.1 spore gernimation protein [Neobacillus vireti]